MLSVRVLRGGLLLMLGAALMLPRASIADPNNNANISCGAPKKAGLVTTTVILKKKGQADQTVSWTASILATDTPEQKAAKIRAAAPATSTVIATPVGGAGNVVSVTAVNGWEIVGIGFAPDGTNQLAAPNVFAMVSNLVQDGLCSFSGTATGSGTVHIGAQQTTATVAVTNGMTAAQIEDQIVSQLASRRASISGSIPGFSGLGGDGRLVRIEQLVGNSLSVDSNVPGVTVDVAAVINLLPPVPGLPPWGGIAIALMLISAGWFFMSRRTVRA